MSKLIKAFFIFLFPFLLLSQNSEEDIHFLTKSMSWKKIYRSLSTDKITGEAHAYALVRYIDETGEKKYLKARLLYGILTGTYPSEVTRTEVHSLLSSPLKEQKVIGKLAYIKLYRELNKQKLLTDSEKYIYLQKLKSEDDPVIIQLQEELLKLYISDEEYDHVIRKVEGYTADEKIIFQKPEIRFYYGKALLKAGKIDEGRKELFAVLLDKRTPKDLKRDIVFNIRKYISSNPENFSKEELSLMINFLDKKEMKQILKDRLLDYNNVFPKDVMIKNVAWFYLSSASHYLIPFLKNNSKVIDKDENFLANMVESLINNNEFGKAEIILNSHLKNSTNPVVYKSFSRLYKKYKNNEKYFSSLIEYLKSNPYDLRSHDQLIDFLANTDSNSITYKSEEYWNKAIEAIPNLPVKGRLIYWYLRYLRYKGDSEKLKGMLSTYYSYCPGSYYTGVIEEEFSAEIKTLTPPENPVSSKDNLIKYLSIVSHGEYIKYLANQNLAFAYYRDSHELNQKLNLAIQKIYNSKKLQNAVEYLKVGEIDRASEIIQDYFDEHSLSETDRFEVYVGVGDASKNTYLSLFYTRQLMKTYRIPDDPILLPPGITNRLYPRPHRELVHENSKEFGIDENIVYAIMRQESFFRENAISPSNARGLMQVMPSTGKIIAKRLKVFNYSLHDPEVSIKFGAKFLADLMNTYGELRWASIAYNGGPGNLRKWKRNHYRNDFNHFLEEMPSKESRDYCRIIISNYMNYKALKAREGS